jgi:NAD(P)-dependent dehydrogenase (short-subunit alcohol dehydrogenase family)
MELQGGQVAVITGAGSGIGLALAERFASAGLNIVAADVQDDALATAAEKIAAHGVEVHTVRCDVSKEEQVAALVEATLGRFGGVHVVCNNAGVAAQADPWFGPLSAWEWVMGVNFWGVVHGCRAFLPHLIGGGHIVNTASIAGLYPGFSPAYDASKHAVVAISEGLYNGMTMAGLPVGVSVLCPGWVRTQIMDADRNWPSELGEKPPLAPTSEIVGHHVRRAIAEGATPAFIADAVADSVLANRFWVLPQQEFLDLVVRRWDTIAERANPAQDDQTPGMPPREQLLAELMAGLGIAPAPTE